MTNRVILKVKELNRVTIASLTLFAYKLIVYINLQNLYKSRRLF